MAELVPQVPQDLKVLTVFKVLTAQPDHLERLEQLVLQVQLVLLVC
jgi:hypothetical protein